MSANHLVAVNTESLVIPEMSEPQVPSASDVATMYDQFTDLFTQNLGDNIHLGFWHDDQDDTPAAEATDRISDLVADRLAPAAGAGVLDVGCGSGRPTLRIAARNQVHVTGITVSPHQVRLAQSRPEAGPGVGQADFQLADAMALPFPDGHFASAYAIESIVHMSDRGKAISEIARTLRPGAHLVIADFFLKGELSAQEADVLAAAAEFFQLPPFAGADQYQPHITAAGLEILDFEDITDNIRRSHQVIAAAIRNAALEFDFDEETRAQIAKTVDLTEKIGTISQLHYALTTARRP